ncbi:MAG TPA: Uma2 family endonuclease [Amycolatopsis sp.]|uniref:Uma2 family endonuclease n=1 Tax=Amycolatopsis sp. TaxID=37632 RepID=UPI002B46879B|nr:Uma2 family endonuclease [Amycolatopsis sp.]HKS46296.1 Uma2 family endonuclease [Amycolatopsis sp.]
MTTAVWPDHLLTLDEWDELPKDDQHLFELAEGVLYVVPKPAPLHQRAMWRLTWLLDEQLPRDLTALPDVEVVVDKPHPPTVRAPDVVVTREEIAQLNPARLDAVDVLVAVEIVSPGTGRIDRVTKLCEYAEAGIPHYWLIDLTEPVALTVHKLADGLYEEVAKATERIKLGEPAALEIDPAGLLARD